MTNSYPGEILRATVGSNAHGLALEGTDDQDQMGVCVESLVEAMGIGSPFEQHIYRSATVRTGDPNARSRAGDLDLTVFSLRKFLRLALKGNPTVLVPLFATGAAVVHQTDRGRELQALAPKIVSKRALVAFQGYLVAQEMKLKGERGTRVHRPELVEKYGYDTKFAMHALRLGYQGLEISKTCRLTLPMRGSVRQHLRDVREGRVTLPDVLAEIERLRAALTAALQDSALPDAPDTEAVERWMLEVYRQAWLHEGRTVVGLAAEQVTR